MAATESQKEQLKEKVANLVKNNFGGDFHKAFDAYDNDKKDGKINKVELVKLLKDAGVGNWLTRGTWADGIISELDTDKDGCISGVEFEQVLT